MEIQVISGFLGAGKTTFLNQYLPVLKGKTVVIENEFGDVGLDGELIQEDVPVREIYAGCICCSLALDFRKGIKELKEQFSPDQLVIEPSGVGRLSDIVQACNKAREKEGIDLTITKLITIVDIKSFEEYREDFGGNQEKKCVPDPQHFVFYWSNVLRKLREHLLCLSRIRYLQSA